MMIHRSFFWNFEFSKTGSFWTLIFYKVRHFKNSGTTKNNSILVNKIKLNFCNKFLKLNSSNFTKIWTACCQNDVKL